jgi:hypothetical protein
VSGEGGKREVGCDEGGGWFTLARDLIDTG